MKEIRLKVIAPPSEGSCAVLDFSGGHRIKSNGDTSLFCGQCGNILAETILFEQCKNLVLRCRCGTYNVIPNNWWSNFHLIDIKESFKPLILFVGLVLVAVGGIVGGVVGVAIGLLATVMLLFVRRKIKILSG